MSWRLTIPDREVGRSEMVDWNRLTIYIRAQAAQAQNENTIELRNTTFATDFVWEILFGSQNAKIKL